MKNFLFVVLFALCSVGYASEPQYDVGDENVKVFMADLNEPAELVATINLFNAEVKMETDRAEIVTAHILDAGLGNYMVAIKTETLEKHYVYVSRRISYKDGKVIKPNKSPSINSKRVKGNSSGDMPRMYRV